MISLIIGTGQILGVKPVKGIGAPLLVAVLLITVMSIACYDKNTGATNIGGSINFKLPAFPESGGHAIEIFTEMHYQPSFRSQEGPRLLPPEYSVPVTGRELTYQSLDEYGILKIPSDYVDSYDGANAKNLYATNCQVCHGSTLKGDGPILPFIKRGPAPANLTEELTRSSSDGEIFGFISHGGRQGSAAIFRGKESASPMPEFRLLLTEKERWDLVQFVRYYVLQDFK